MSGSTLDLLFSHNAPSGVWDPSVAPYSRCTSTRPRPAALEPGYDFVLGPIQVPSCFFQINFIRGGVVWQINPPAGTYSAQGRLVDADNGGTTPCPTLTPTRTRTSTPTPTRTPYP